MELWFILAIVGIFAVSIIVYVLLMLFFPEWVGITGKVALNAERSHREESLSEDSENKTVKTLDSSSAEKTTSNH